MKYNKKAYDAENKFEETASLIINFIALENFKTHAGNAIQETTYILYYHY